MRLSRFVILVLVMSTLCCQAALGAAMDEVALRSGRHYFGEVVTDTFDEVALRDNNDNIKKWKADEVVSIHYSDRPDSFREGLELLANLQYSDAAAKFQDALGAEGREWLPVYAAFHLGEALALNGQYARAEAAYRRCGGSNRKSRFYHDAMMGIGLCQFALGKRARAAATFDDLAKSASAKSYRMTAQVLKANLLLLDDNDAAAQQILDGLKDKAIDDARLSGSVTLGLELLAARKGEARAAKLAQALDGPASNGLKVLAAKELARRSLDAGEPEDALLKLLRADFSVSRGATGERFATEPLKVAAGDRGGLLFQAAGCAEMLKRTDEAVALYQSVRRVDANSAWARKAAAKLRQLR